MELRGIEVAEQGSPEWYAARNNGIGASEIAAALGLNPYCTALELFMRKRGLLPELEENLYMAIGKAVEPVIVSRYAKDRGVDVVRYPVPMLRHESEEWAFASIDALISEPALLECKNTGKQWAKLYLGEPGSDQVPEYWLLQVQFGLAISGLELGRLAVAIERSRIDGYRFEADTELHAILFERGREFWDRVQAGDPPPADLEHESTPKLIERIYSTVCPGKEARANPESAAKLLEYRRLSDAIAEHEAKKKELEKARKKLKSEFIQQMGDAEILLFEDGSAVRRSVVESAPVSYTRDQYSTLRIQG